MNIKGSAIIHSRTFVQGLWGAEALEWVTSHIDEAARTVLTSPSTLAHGWYQVAVWNAVVEAVVDGPAKGDRGIIRELAAYVAQKDLTTAYRILLKIGSPDMLMKRAGVFWSKYFDGGGMEGVQSGENRFRILLRAGTDAAFDPGPLTCQEAVPAWQEHAVRLTGTLGGKSVHVRCRFDGSDACEYDVSWTR